MLWTLCGFIDIMALHVALYFGSIGFSWCCDRGHSSTSIQFICLSVTCTRKLYTLKKDAIAPQMSLKDVPIINNTAAAQPHNYLRKKKKNT